ncbi:MAG TPA: hypothetical protein VGO62_20935, partial [Myxococcota bacterium]
HYLYADVVQLSDNKLALAHRLSSIADAVKNQSSDILFGHARGPEYLRDAFRKRTYDIASDQLASTVLRVSSSAWTSEDLTKLFEDCASAAFSRTSSSGKRESYEYAYDLLEAFRDHPAATPAIIADADKWMTQLAREATRKGYSLAGRKAWTPSPLGFSLPNYN